MGTLLAGVTALSRALQRLFARTRTEDGQVRQGALCKISDATLGKCGAPISARGGNLTILQIVTPRYDTSVLRQFATRARGRLEYDLPPRSKAALYPRASMSPKNLRTGARPASF